MTPKISNIALLEDFVSQRVMALSRRSAQGDSSAKATLARLRRASTDPMEESSMWGEVFENFPPELVGQTPFPRPADPDEPNCYELAAYVSLCLFACHQQSRNESMHQFNVGLGRAIRKLANPGDTEEFNQAVMSRFHTLATADRFERSLHYLRAVVQLLRQEAVPLDYGKLAVDLAQLQQSDRASSVRLRWARQLHASRSKKTSSK